MRKVCASIFTIGLIVAAASPAFAQRQPGGSADQGDHDDSQPALEEDRAQGHATPRGHGRGQHHRDQSIRQTHHHHHHRYWLWRHRRHHRRRYYF